MSVDVASMSQTISAPGVLVPPSAASQIVKDAVAKVEGGKQDPAKEVPRGTDPAKEEPKEVAKEDPASKRFAMLARREQKIQKDLEAIKTRELGLTEREAKIAQHDAVKKEVALNPKKALEYFGVSYEELTNFILQGEKPTPEMQVKKVESDFEAYKKQQEEERQKATQRQSDEAQGQYKQVIEQFETDVTEFVKKEAETYELINLYGLAPVVIETIKGHFDKTGKVLDFKEAADLVEAHYEAEAVKFSQTKKFQAKVAQPQPKAPEEPPTPAPSRTLNNAISPTTPSYVPPSTDAERFQRALAKLQK